MVAKPHGIRGEVIVDNLSDSPDRFAAGAVLMVGPSETMMRVVRSSDHKGRLIVAFEGVVDRNQAETMRGWHVVIDNADIMPLDEDAFWEHELVGMAVIDTSGNTLGVLSSVVRRQEQDLWCVTVEGGNEVLVPAVKPIVHSVDRNERLIVLHPPGGLFDAGLFDAD
ncbi:MAG: ribosome maturation factor RimM [Actinomycetota bacterium]